MNKKLTTGLKSLGLIILAIVLLSVFGFGSVTKFVFKKMLFTPYNIVGIIMTIVAICGGYINKRQGHWLKLVLTILCGIVSIFSFACTICSWFNINLLYLIWANVLKPAVVSVGTVLLWILIVVVGISVTGFTIYGIVKLICYIKEEKEWKTSQSIYQSQKIIVDQIARENFKQNADYKTPNSKGQQTISNIKEVEPEQKPDEGTKVQLKEEIQQVRLPNDYELKISNNICPECGWYLKKRINRETGEQFRGCTNFAYHECTFTISDDEFIRIYKKYH